VEKFAMSREATKRRESQIVKSYVWVLRAPKDADGRRTVSLARHGVYEVRLIEPSDVSIIDLKPFWIELYDHDNKVSVDSFGGDDIEETAVAAETLIARAIMLNAPHAPSGQSPEARSRKLHSR
jgi:hypothetical protein